MIEFAVSAVVLFTLIFGCVGLAMALFTTEVVNQYARDASRYAIVHGSGCSYLVSGAATSCSIGTGGGSGAPASIALKSYLNNEIFPGINGANLSVRTTYGPPPGLASCLGAGCNSAGNQVTVDVSYPFLYNIPFIPSRLITIHGSSTMIISQ
jgi:hypothetical protein